MDTAPAIRIREWRGWTTHDIATLGSTNDHARALLPWHAVRALVQTGARGRHGRKWTSGQGGLWFSAVLPLEPRDCGWEAFPLAAGLAVVSTLQQLGLHEARIRWPNDVLVGPRKICGILMEKFAPDRVVVGLGLNVTNRPAEEDPSLRRIATSLIDELPETPTADDLFLLLLDALRALHAQVAAEGFASLAHEINLHWGGTREVELHLPDETVRGRFLGIDPQGNLLVETGGRTSSHAAPRVQLLREV